MSFKFRRILACSLTLMCCMLAACGRLELGSAEISRNAEHISAVIEADDITLLDSLPELKTVDLSGSRCYEEICAWAQAHPEVYVHYTVELPGGTIIDSHSTEAEISIDSAAVLEDTAALLKYLPRLEALTLNCRAESLRCRALEQFAESRPDIKFHADLRIAGVPMSTEARRLRLTELSRADIERLISVLPAMYNLETLDLGSDAENPNLDFSLIKKLQEAKPGLELIYSFSIYERQISLSDRVLDLSYTDISDEGALVRQIIPCMPELEMLDMDTSGVSDEAMASIRDDFPDIKVVWRVWFGDNYCVRTDVETILASRPSIGGNLVKANTQSLKYCTEVRYLDVGHNDLLEDISFISYMPKLEVAILAMGVWSDTTPIADCPNLEYLEIQTTCLTDLRPLSGLTKLRHLNICYLFELDDISPLYPLTELERLWIGCLDPVPQEQIDEMQRRAPQCVINTTTYDPTEGGWRYRPDLEGGLDPRYALLREQFGYAKGNAAFAFPWNDPKYR